MSRVSPYALCLSLLLAAWGRSGNILARSWSSWRDRKSFAGRLLEHYTSLHCTTCKKYFRSSLQAAVLLLTCKESAIWRSLLESPCRSLPAGMVTHASTLIGMQQGRPESHVSSRYLHLAVLDTVITVNEWWHPVKLSGSSFLNILIFSPQSAGNLVTLFLLALCTWPGHCWTSTSPGTVQGAGGTRPLLSIGMTPMPRQSWKWIDFIVTDLPRSDTVMFFRFFVHSASGKWGSMARVLVGSGRATADRTYYVTHIHVWVHVCMPAHADTKVSTWHTNDFECPRTSTHSMSVVVLLNQGDISYES